MKKYLLGLYASALPLIASQAQHNFEWYSNGGDVFIAAGAQVEIRGDVHHMGNSFLTHNGNMRVQGNMYSSNNFQQRGTGLVRLQNANVNTTETQFIQGSYAVRGGQSQIGVNDGSFARLELANSLGIVWLNGTGPVADVRLGLDFEPVPNLTNRIITADPDALPSNGSGYPAVFGLMNPNLTMEDFNGNVVDEFGLTAGGDAGYIQGKFRQAINPLGGNYLFMIGLQPSPAVGSQVGPQMMQTLVAGGNNFDVIEAYFESASPNAVAGSLIECTGTEMNYFAGTDHGQWFLSSLGGLGQYSLQVWPQDDNIAGSAPWLINRSNAFAGTANDCGTDLNGLTRSGFSGLGNNVGFGVVGRIITTNLAFLELNVRPRTGALVLDWVISEEKDVDVYQIERSLNGSNFEVLGQVASRGNSMVEQTYQYEDGAVFPQMDYYYRVRAKALDGSETLSPIRLGRLGEGNGGIAVQLFPNPTREGLTAQLNILSPKAELIQIQVYDALGRLLYQQQADLQVGDNTLSLPSQTWAKGVYSLRLQAGAWQATKQWLLN